MPRVRATELTRGAPTGPPRQSFVPPEHWAGSRVAMFMSGCVWGATGGGQRPVALARVFARRGWSVVYYNWEATGSWWAGGPLVLSRDTLAEIMPALKRVQGMLVCGLPSHVFYDPAVELQRAGWCLAYDTIDDWEAFHAGGEATWYKAEVEQSFMAEADILTASAPALVQKVEARAGRVPTLVRNAGPRQAIAAGPPPGDMRFGAAGTVVYVGYLYGHWFDWKLLEQSARDMPEVAFNIVGDRGSITVPKAPNLNFVGERPYTEAMRYMLHADASIIPFKGDQLSAAVDPIKYYDAMAAGIPTVATACLSDLRGRELAVLAVPGAQSLAPAIRGAVEKGRWGRQQIDEWLARNSWSARADTMISLYDEWLVRRAELKPASVVPPDGAGPANEVPKWLQHPRDRTEWKPVVAPVGGTIEA